MIEDLKIILTVFVLGAAVIILYGMFNLISDGDRK